MSKSYYFKSDCLVPAKLGTVFSQEKEKLDLHLQSELMEDGFASEFQSDKNHRSYKVHSSFPKLLVETN